MINAKKAREIINIKINESNKKIDAIKPLLEEVLDTLIKEKTTKGQTDLEIYLAIERLDKISQSLAISNIGYTYKIIFDIAKVNGYTVGDLGISW